MTNGTNKPGAPAPVGKPAKAEPPEPAASGLTPEVTVKINDDHVPDPKLMEMAERMARRLCEADGQKPDDFFLGATRWSAFLPWAVAFIVCTEVMAEIAAEAETEAND